MLLGPPESAQHFLGLRARLRRRLTPLAAPGSPSQRDPLERQQPALALDARHPVAADPVSGHDSMAREDEREAVLRAEAPGRARRTRPAGQGGELAVRDDLAPRHRLERSSELGLEGGAPGEIDVDVSVRDPLTAEVAVEAAAPIR